MLDLQKAHLLLHLHCRLNDYFPPNVFIYSSLHPTAPTAVVICLHEAKVLLNYENLISPSVNMLLFLFLQSGVDLFFLETWNQTCFVLLVVARL